MTRLDHQSCSSIFFWLLSRSAAQQLSCDATALVRLWHIEQHPFRQFHLLPQQWPVLRRRPAEPPDGSLVDGTRPVASAGVALFCAIESTVVRAAFGVDREFSALRRRLLLALGVNPEAPTGVDGGTAARAEAAGWTISRSTASPTAWT
ncbi:hypothetical protein [Nocardia abscessus]|uniref:hypothetical protein n=1 Tax=Nocardia abscessus TaxID=120957 RepID=UPI0024571D9E|nr:hypothetical protein [Nocardia abscessus]